MVTIVLIFFLMAIFVGDPGAASARMDKDLKESHASFIGEVTGDMSGLSVAGAGDVNGDGYDDILIGAYDNDDGGSLAGQTYLIFGSPSGWTVDTDLSNANASFWGENTYDHSGSSVAGAGDVNGDGYDDILIGAFRDSDGGHYAGQTYLILGKSSGWVMDTDLSNADASFWGEDKDDESGYSVAGAGDVNGDGYDDILIGAAKNEDGGITAGQTYLIFGKATGWAMDINLSNVNASFIGEDPYDSSGYSVAGAGDVNGDGYDDILIGAKGNDDGGSSAGQTYLILGKASGWAMDTNLSASSASFRGEDPNDYSGVSVSGAGDVNGDGYDDIIIGAEYYKGGIAFGQTYLILGKATGWAMHTDLSAADASFWGEGDGEYSSNSVAGVGDVNGDGYDDILIGDPWNSEAGNASGQTYLILGRASGWAMDTNLSNADESFLGEDAMDYSGTSVAGAGDVNGDGYDDLLIGAMCNDDGGSNAGQTYLIFCNDGAPPRIETDSSPTNATTGDPFIFNITVSDNYGVQNVSIEFWYGESQSHYNRTANQSSGDQIRGTWLENISIPFNSTDGLHYIVHVMDKSFYVNSSKQKDVRVQDNDPPVLVDDMTISEGTTGDNFTFLVNVTDNIKLSDVMVEYWYGNGGARTNISMSQISGDMWGFSITVPSDSLDTLHYGFYAEDNSTNHATTSVTDIPVLDNDPPGFIRDRTNPNATAGRGHKFVVEVTDNVNLTNVSLEYWYGTAGEHLDLPLVYYALGDEWLNDIWILRDVSETIYYFFHAQDNSSNINTTEVSGVKVWDVDRPTIVDDASDTYATTGDSFVFRINVTDNIAVSSAHAIIWWGIGTPINNTMTAGDNGMWTNQIWIPSTNLDPMTYRLKVVDTSGNWNESDVNTIIPTDNDPPVLVADASPRETTTGEDLTVTVRLSDNLGVESATLSYWYNDSPSTDVQMTPGPSYTVTITVADILDSLGYVIIARDIHGNEMTTQLVRIGITDNDSPTLVEDLTPTAATTGDPHTFRVEVSDNIDIESVHVEYRFVNEISSLKAAELTEETPGIWSLSIPVPLDSLDPIRYVLFISDSSGNRARSPEMGVVVRDDEGPEIVLTLPRETQIKGMPLEVIFACTDNIEVGSIRVAYWYGDGDVHNESTGFPIHLEVPRHPGGDLFLMVSAVDMAGNWNSTEAHRIPLANIPPGVANLPTWNVVESTDAEYGLLNHITDPNDDTFTITCLDGDVTVDGMVLKVRYDAVVPDRTITLTVSDGDDEVEATLTIHVISVNDLPIINNLLPANGTKVKEGKTIVFTVSVSDEDGDDLTVTWTSDGVTIGTGAALDYKKLKPGTRTIKVTVSDGEASVEEEFTVVIQKEEESPGPGLVAALAAVVLAGLVQVRRRGQRRAW